MVGLLKEGVSHVPLLKILHLNITGLAGHTQPNLTKLITVYSRNNLKQICVHVHHCHVR